jgi:glyoxylase-like metal-dependent hydrolase (beta-lactamase superfamily II)
MPLPFALDHINLWLLKDCIEGVHGWTLIDCGIDSAVTRQLWERIIDEHLGGEPILRVIATHMHPDHLGNAHWLCERFGAGLWMSSTEFYVAHHALVCDSGFGGPLVSQFMAEHGLQNPQWLSAIEQRADTFAKMVPKVPDQFIQIKHDQTILIGNSSWHCIEGYGHSPEHISLYNPEHHILISGDMLLPKISTNVSVWATAPQANPVQEFLDSLKHFDALEPQTLVCPSHGLPFLGVGHRLHELRVHHKERLDEVFEACAIKPHSAHDVISIMFKRALDLHQITFAMGEALAHLNWWWHKGSLKRKRTPSGVFVFSV